PIAIPRVSQQRHGVAIVFARCPLTHRYLAALPVLAPFHFLIPNSYFLLLILLGLSVNLSRWRSLRKRPVRPRHDRARRHRSRSICASSRLGPTHGPGSWG